MCVHKPVAGERPLWDFPDGTLAGREVATYVVSEATGWDLVPPTVMRGRARSGRACASCGSTSTRRVDRRPARPLRAPRPRPHGRPRRRRQQRRPQGRPPAASAGRTRPGRRPRGDLQRRGQAAHGAVGVAAASPLDDEAIDVLARSRPSSTRHSGRPARRSTLRAAAHPARDHAGPGSGCVGSCATGSTRTRGASGRPSRGPRSDRPRSPVRLRACTPGPGRRRPAASGPRAPAPTLRHLLPAGRCRSRGRADRPDVRLRHHALRRHPPRARQHLRDVRPACTASWLDAGLEVDYVQNVTDVDDPLLERATATGEDWRDLAERETELLPRRT